MSNEWIQVVKDKIDDRFRLLTREICYAADGNSNDLYSDQECSPSIITFAQSLPSCVDFGRESDIRPQSGCSASVKSLGDTEGLLLWLNVLKLSEPRLIHEAQTAGWDNLYKDHPVDPYSLIIRISYEISDVVVITGDNLDKAADRYLVWRNNCRQSRSRRSSTKRGIKPDLFIVVEDSPYEKDIEKHFLESCFLSDKAQAIGEKELKADSDSLFNSCEYLTYSAKVKEKIIKSVRTRRRLRESKKHMWSQLTLCKLQKSILDNLTRKVQGPLNVVKILSSATEIEEATTNLWPELYSLLQTVPSKENADEFIDSFFVPVIASCVGWSALKQEHRK